MTKSKDTGFSSVVPVPDPSARTIDELGHVQKNIRDYVDSQLGIRDERLGGMDRAAKLLAETVNRVPTEVTREVNHLKMLTEEKIGGIYTVLAEREKQAAASASLIDTALQAALKAQQEAAAKQTEGLEKSIAVSARATQETIAKNEQIATAGVNGLDVRFAELKDQVSDLRATSAGSISDLRTSATAEINNLRNLVTTIAATRPSSADQITDRRSSQQNAMMALALFISVAAIIVTIILTRHA